jgi:hypothetical protein
MVLISIPMLIYGFHNKTNFSSLAELLWDIIYIEQCSPSDGPCTLLVQFAIIIGNLLRQKIIYNSCAIIIIVEMRLVCRVDIFWLEEMSASCFDCQCDVIFTLCTFLKLVHNHLFI